MRRKLVISDIHGCFREFGQLLEVAGYTPQEDQLILLGDYVDRGPQSKEVVDFVLTLSQQHGAIALQGNHDERFVDVVSGNQAGAEEKFLEHGGRQAIDSYLSREGQQIGERQSLLSFQETVRAIYPQHVTFLKSLPYYYEDEDHIYVHAGLNPAYSHWKEQPKRDFLYIKDDFYRNPTRVEKTVVFGHTPTSNLHGSANVWFHDGKIGIDGGCAYGMQLNALEIRGENDYRTYQVKVER